MRGRRPPELDTINIRMARDEPRQHLKQLVLTCTSMSPTATSLRFRVERTWKHQRGEIQRGMRGMGCELESMREREAYLAWPGR